MEKIYSMDEIQLDDLDSIIGGNNESYSNINGTINIKISNQPSGPSIESGVGMYI